MKIYRIALGLLLALLLLAPAEGQEIPREEKKKKSWQEAYQKALKEWETMVATLQREAREKLKKSLEQLEKLLKETRETPLLKKEDLERLQKLVRKMQWIYRDKTLDRAGRMVQTVFMLARRYTITRRVPHQVIFFSRYGGPEKRIQYGLKIFRHQTPYDDIKGKAGKDRGGYTAEEYLLPEGCKINLYFTNKKNSHFAPDPGKGLPPEKGFQNNQNPHSKGRVVFQKNGSLSFKGDYRNMASFDPKHSLKNGDEAPSRIRADILITQKGSPYLCYLDMDPSTGRVYMRILKVLRRG